MEEVNKKNALMFLITLLIRIVRNFSLGSSSKIMCKGKLSTCVKGGRWLSITYSVYACLFALPLFSFEKGMKTSLFQPSFTVSLRPPIHLLSENTPEWFKLLRDFTLSVQPNWIPLLVWTKSVSLHIIKKYALIHKYWF